MTSILIIIALNLIVYFRTLRYSTVIDDNCRRLHQKDIPKNWFHRIFRVTRYSGYGGLPTEIDHLLNIILHTLACVSIYLVLGKSDISFIASILFSIHPANNQGSIWLNGKRYAITTILILCMWALGPYGLPIYLVSPLWHIGSLPAIFLYCLTPHKWILWSFFIVLFVFNRILIDKLGTRWEKIPYGEIKRVRPMKLVILTKVFGYSFLHCLLPRRMSFWHMFMERFGFSKEDNKYWYSFNKDFWIGLAVIGGVVTLIITNWNNPLGFGLFWWALFNFMWCHFPFGVNQAISERVYYLPNVGLCYALAYLFKLPYGSYLLTGLFVYYLTKLWFYMPAYKNLDEFYRHALFAFPDQFRARGHIVTKELEERKVFWALRNAGVGLGYTPKDCVLNFLMAKCLITLGAWQQAAEYVNKAKENIIPGQEKYISKTIKYMENIIDSRIKNPSKPLPKRIQPGEVVNIPPSQIMRGQ